MATSSSSTVLSFLVLQLLIMIFSSSLPVSSAPCHPDDQKALLAIKSAFNNSAYFATWIPGTACCDFGWNGIGCGTNGTRVISLFIAKDANITGTIPPAIGDLLFLQSLSLQNLPNLSGTIPSSITKLNDLLFLDLSKNFLSGPIPNFLSQLTSLTFLSLAFNRFSGSIPPSLSNLQKLGALVLDHNRLNGSIPASFGRFPIDTGTLYLSHNRLSGPIPKSMGRPHWPIIDLSRNHLTGDASFLFGSSKATLQMDLSKNQLSFDLTHVTFSVRLTSLDLSHNAIYGSIPAQINQVTGIGLEKFNVSYNRLCGKIPAGEVTAKFDQYAYFNNLCLCGAPLPVCKTK